MWLCRISCVPQYYRAVSLVPPHCCVTVLHLYYFITSVLHCVAVESEDICGCGRFGRCDSATMQCLCDAGYIPDYLRETDKCIGKNVVLHLINYHARHRKMAVVFQQ